MAQKNDNSLFPNTDLFGVGNNSDDLFASEKPLQAQSSQATFGQTLLTTALKPPKPLTKAQLKQQAELERQRQIGSVTDQINQMRNTPEWQNASLDKRNELYDSWLKDKYQPAMKNIQDSDLRGALMRLPATLLRPDITNLQKSVDDSSRLNDVWQGIKATGNQMLQGFGDYAPATYNQARVDNLTSMLAQDGQPMVLGGVAQLKSDGSPVIQQFTPEQRKTVQDEINAQLALRDQHLKDAAVSDKDIAANRAAQSIGQADRNTELKEDQATHGDFLGTLANAAANPSNALQLAVEQAPNIVPAVALSTLGLAGAAAAGSVLSGQDAMSTAIQQVQQLPDAALQQLPEYKTLRDSGMDEANAKNTLALRAGTNGALLGSIVGLATGPLGAEAGAGKLLSRVATNAASDVTTESAARILATAAAKGLGRTGLEGVEEGGTQVAANYGQQQATGGNNDLLAGVGEAAAQGIIAGAPLGGGSEIISAARDIRNRGTAPAPSTEGGTPNDTTTPTGENGTPNAAAPATEEGQITDLPNAAQAAAAEQAGTAGAGAAATTDGAPVVSPTPDAARATETVNALRTTFNELRSKPGQTLTEAELTTLMEQLHTAEEAGVSMDAIRPGLDQLGTVRALAEGNVLGASSLTEAYDRYQASRVAAETQTVAQEAQATFSTGDFINGTTDATLPGADYTGTATRAGLNSEMATPASRDGAATDTVSTDAGQINSAPETTGDGGATGNNATADGSNQAANAELGTVEQASTADGGLNNQPVPGSSEAISAGERSQSGGAGQRTADGGSNASTGIRETGSNTGPVAGQTVQYQGTFANAPVMTGEITAVNADGTFNMRTAGGMSLTNLPQANIQTEAAPVAAPAAPATPVQEASAPAPEASTTQAASTSAPEVLGTTQEAAPAVTEATQERTGAMTPTGRDVDRLTAQAERLYDYKDGQYAVDAANLSVALEEGDVTTADSIADYLYSQGLRQFKPANVNTGRAKTVMDNSFANDLSSAERLALQREYENQKEGLPAELAGFGPFRDAMVADALLVEGGQQPLNSVFNNLSQTARNIIQKIAKALATVILAITINNSFPVNDAVAAQGVSTFSHVTETQGLAGTASTVNSWVKEKGDNAGQRYIIADKVSGEIHVMDANGKVLATAPALYGAKTGDGMSLGETPAGIFSLQQEAAPKSYGGDLQQFATAPDGDILAIHRVLTTNPKQNRLGRLASKTAADNRVSLGCINIPVDIYNKYLSSGFKGKLYIIPDQKKLGDVFKGIDEVRAKQNLNEGQQAPQDLSASSNAEFQSSTPTLAAQDNEIIQRAQTARRASGANITTAARDMDLGTATSEMAGHSNDPAQAGMGLASIIPLLAAWRLRRKAKQRGMQGTTGADTEPAIDAGNTPTQGLGPDKISGEDYHKITATNEDLSNNNQQQRQSWLADVQTKAVERLVDSEYRFVNWTQDAGLVAPGREYDSSPLVQSLKLMPNRIRARQAELAQRFFKPISDLLLRVSMDKGVSPDVVGAHLGIWTTAQHVPEANRELRKTLQRNVDETMFGVDDAAFQKVQEDLRAFDDYQRGTGAQVEMAGGMTDAQARALSARIEGYGYNLEDLQRFQQMTVQAFQGLTQERVNNGVLLQEEVEQWNAHNFQNYVALYVDKSAENTDAFIGTSNFNPAGDYTRKGSLSPANHALITLHQYLYRTAAGIESGRFKYDLHNTYTNLKATGDTKGLQRVNMASQFISKDVQDKTGFYYTERTTDETGAPVRATYKYYFDDNRIADGILKKTAEPAWSALKNLAAMTNIHARFITKYDMSFAPINWMRDGWERATILSSRALFDADGNKLSLLATAPRMYAATFNPVNVATLLAYLYTGKFGNSRAAKGFEDLRTQGGLSTYQHALQSSRDGMRTELKKLKGTRKALGQLDAFFTQWNEAFSAAPAVGGYLALKDMGVPAREAAFRTLDVMNTNNRGYWTPTMRAFAPFVTPSLEGGRNMLRNLSTGRGRAVFASQVMLAATAYALLLGAAPDDDDKGNLLDAMKLGDLSRIMPLFNKDGSYEKLAVSFGASRLAWILGAGMNRMSRGVDTVGDVVSNVSLAALQELQPADYASDVYADNFVSGLLMTAMPSILTPALEVALNQNHFGSRIHGQKTAEGYASDAAMSKTPAIWSTVAQGISSATGGAVDMYPESVRHMMQSYLVGPTRAINTAMEADTLYTTGGQLNTRQQLGWMWDAVGVQRFWDNGTTGTARKYYDTQDKALGVLKKYHVSSSDQSNTPGTKAASAANRILDAGGSMEEAMLVEFSIQAETDRQKMNTAMKGKVKEYKRDDLDLETLAPDYEIHAAEQEALMRAYIRNTGGLK